MQDHALIYGVFCKVFYITNLVYYYVNTSITAVNTHVPESMTCLHKSNVFHSCPVHVELLKHRYAICVVVCVRH